jgi:hypothetical protein
MVFCVHQANGGLAACALLKWKAGFVGYTNALGSYNKYDQGPINICITHPAFVFY